VKKNPGGCTVYPEKHWNLVSVSPKCGKTLGYTRYRIQVQGLEFEVGNKFLLRQLTGILDPSGVLHFLTKIPLRNKK
jgi:hypothetical protein